jgi:large subunit ribosomal protein L14
MLQMGSLARVADNSGAVIIKCIKVRIGSHTDNAKIGDIINVSVLSLAKGKKNLGVSKVKKGVVYLAVVVRTRQRIRRIDGSYVRFDDNAVVILNKQLEPIGTRIFGAIPREIKNERFMKIISLAPEVI